MSTRTLIERYNELKPKLEREIVGLDKERLCARNLVGILKSDWPIRHEDLVELYNRQIRLLRESLELHKDTFSGEDDDLT